METFFVKKGGLRTLYQPKVNSVDNPLVSIITIVFNGEKYLEQAIQSVLNQDYTNIEYLIIDGNSSDSSVSIIKKYENHIDYWQSEPDKGIYDAMNKGIKLAKGKYIGLLNADDYYAHKSVINQVVKNFEISQADIVYGDVMYEEAEKKQYLVHASAHITLKGFRQMPLNHPATFVKSSVYTELGLFDINFKIAGDWEFILRCFLASKKFYYLPEVLTHFRIGGISKQKFHRAYYEVFSTLLRKKLLPKYYLYYYWVNYWLKSYFKQFENSLFINKIIEYYRKTQKRYKLII